MMDGELKLKKLTMVDLYLLNLTLVHTRRALVQAGTLPVFVQYHLNVKLLCTFFASTLHA